MATLLLAFYQIPAKYQTNFDLIKPFSAATFRNFDR